MSLPWLRTVMSEVGLGFPHVGVFDHVTLYTKHAKQHYHNILNILFTKYSIHF